jgi:opacity protein-like surface antigen
VLLSPTRRRVPHRLLAIAWVAFAMVALRASGAIAQSLNRPELTGQSAGGATAADGGTHVVGFADFAYGRWLASDTFEAVLGSAGAPMFGGGAEVRFRRFFVSGAVEWFHKTGERVVVDNGMVYPLGIPDSIRVIPIAGTFGYRHSGGRLTPYVGGGMGVYLYHETSDFAAASEEPDRRFASYHVLGGVEFDSPQWVRVAFEVQFTTVPSALGDSGVSRAFGESNLGNTQFRVKLLVGPSR